MPKRPCASPGCSALVAQGYCDEHNKVTRGSNWRIDRGTTTERGYGYAWQRLRKRILLRDYHLCQRCLKQGRTVSANHVDHIMPRHRGGTDAPENLQALCQSCHEQKTASEDSKGGT